MSEGSVRSVRHDSLSRVYPGWASLAVASLGMVGTLPGRTQGLGLITESLLADLKIDRVHFAEISLWATLIGALFCIGIGRLIDRFGTRLVLTITSLALGLVVLVMSRSTGATSLTILITLTRGFGQSALSVISLTMVGHWFKRRLTLAMALYTVFLSVGFMIAFPVVGQVVLSSGWRVAWAGIGFALVFGLVPLGYFLVRPRPASFAGTIEDDRNATGKRTADDEAKIGFTLRQALATSAFWVFALSSSIYGLIASGIALFNESILAERGFDAATYHTTLVITALTALIGNFLGGWLSAKWQMNRLMALAMALVAIAQLALPNLSTRGQVTAYAIVMGLAGGFVMVVFFSYWTRYYGRAHLGKIQGAAQTLTVIASATGPLLLAQCVEITGSYAFVFYCLAAVVTLLGLAAWLVPEPKVG